MHKEVDFIMFAEAISHIIQRELKKYYREKLLSGLAKVDYEDNTQSDSKGSHKIDKYTKNVIIDVITEDFSEVMRNANIYIEGEPVLWAEEPTCCILIDPVDGSRSADQHIGDPCMMLAFTPVFRDNNLKFKHIQTCYIRGLHSGDRYFTYQGKAYYVPEGYKYSLLEDGRILLDETRVLNAITLKKSSKSSLKDASVIVRDGYGMRNVVSSKINHDILNEVKHTFSYDITGIELCYLASGRDIVNLVVEARRHFKDGKWAGSDGFNLMAYPLVKAAGGMIYTLDGQELDEIIFEPSEIYDFIAASDQALVEEFIRGGVKHDTAMVG